MVNIMETNNGPVLKGNVLSVDAKGRPTAIDWNVDNKEEEFSEDHLMGGAIVSGLYLLIVVSVVIGIIILC